MIEGIFLGKVVGVVLIVGDKGSVGSYDVYFGKSVGMVFGWRGVCNFKGFFWSEW